MLHCVSIEREVVALESTERLIEELLAIVLEQEVVHHFECRRAALLRDTRHTLLAVRLVVRHLAEREDAPQQIIQREAGHRLPDRALLGEDPHTHCRIPQACDLLRERSPSDLGREGGMAHEYVEVRRETVQHAGWPSSDLRPYFDSVRSE